jgi:hypothetical protein
MVNINDKEGATGLKAFMMISDGNDSVSGAAGDK